jgi:hypothetical protein
VTHNEIDQALAGVLRNVPPGDRFLAFVRWIVGDDPNNAFSAEDLINIAGVMARQVPDSRRIEIAEYMRCAADALMTRLQS